MPERSYLPLEVRTYEVDAYGTAPAGSYLKWMQDAAIFASGENGFDTKRYHELGTTWVLGEFLMEIDGKCRIGDRISVETWVVDFGAASSHRQYRIRTADDTVIVRGEAEWVYLDARRMRPKRLSKELLNEFKVAEGFALEDRDWGSDVMNTPPSEGVIHETPHIVRWSELDGARHVNNTIYANWVTDHLAEAAADAGGEGPGDVRRLRLRYKRGAKLGEMLTWRLTSAGNTAVQDVLAPDGTLISQAAVEWA